MYPRSEKISRITEAISTCSHFVMAGSMDSFHEHFDPFFELVVHLHTNAQVRMKRVHDRELALFGERILEGGDMYAEHQKFLNDIAGYDLGIGGCTLQQHELWLKSLKCKVIHLDGAHALEDNLNIILETCSELLFPASSDKKTKQS